MKFENLETTQARWPHVFSSLMMRPVEIVYMSAGSLLFGKIWSTYPSDKVEMLADRQPESVVVAWQFEPEQSSIMAQLLLLL